MITLRNESDDTSLNGDVLAVCCDVVAACAQIVASDPPLGQKPFVVQQADDGIPRACLNGLPNEYIANITCLHTHQYAQIGFQLGHELAHFYVNPHFSNWFIESVCTAISFRCLAALTDRWATAPPFPHWRGYAPSFTKYRQDIVADALPSAELATVKDIPQWVCHSLRSVVLAGNFSRQHEMLCGDMIADVMVQHRSACLAVTKLGMASQVAGITNFIAWQESVSTGEAVLVDILATDFRHGF